MPRQSAPSLWPDLGMPMQSMVARLLHQGHGAPLRQLMIVGAAGSVGTTLVARQTAVHLSELGGLRVLLVEVDDTQDPAWDGVSPPQAQPPSVALRVLRMTHPVCLGLFSAARIQSRTAGLPEAWLAGIDVVVWDVPTPSASPVALVMASTVDGIVLTLQAHQTRRAVAVHVAQTLSQSGGKVLGVVLNRSQRFIPHWLYRWL